MTILILLLLVVAQMRTTIGEARNLPAVLTTEQAADLLGVSVDHLWALARAGRAPIEPLRLGRAYRWPSSPLLTLLGVFTESSTAATRNEAPDSTTEAPFISLATSDRQVGRERHGC